MPQNDLHQISETLDATSVHFWWVDLACGDAERQCYLDSLPAEDQVAVLRFSTPNLQRRATVAKAVTRQILAAYLSEDPASLVFDKNAHGKPNVTHSQGLQFNLSHSGECMLLGVCLGEELGVDVEYTARNVDVLPIAERFFHQEEVAAIHAAKPADRQDLFYEIWVKKEAFVKAKGRGLSYHLDKFYVSGTVAGKAGVEGGAFEVIDDGVHVTGWKGLALRAFGPDYSAAAIIGSDLTDVKVHYWSPPLR